MQTFVAIIVACLLLPFFTNAGHAKPERMICGIKYDNDPDVPEQQSNSRIINGMDAKPHEFPWQISLRTHKYRSHFCGGALIGHQWVLTAAHCVDHGFSFYVVLGAHKRSSINPHQVSVNNTEIQIHPKWDRKKLLNDIALVKLARPVKFSCQVAPICLPKKNKSPIEPECYISGWGKTDGNSTTLPDTLQEAKVPVVSHSQCRKKYGPFINRRAHLCIGEGQAGSAGSCNGDSGGPLSCKGPKGTYELHGAVSFGLKYCPVTHFSVMARVSSYMSWITKKSGIGHHGRVYPIDRC